MSELKKFIAKRVAQELHDGDVVNLGIGLPTLVADFVPEGVDITLHSENGFIGIGPAPDDEHADFYLVNAGGTPASINKNGAFFDSSVSFAIARGGHVDVTVLGALEVDEHGNIANWIVPGKKVPGMGGAMDLVVGAKKVIVAMEHTNNGNKKLLKQCRLPLTAVGAVDRIITELAVIDITDDGFVLKEYNPRYTLEEIQNATEAHITVSPDLKPMNN